MSKTDDIENLEAIYNESFVIIGNNSLSHVSNKQLIGNELMIPIFLILLPISTCR